MNNISLSEDDNKTDSSIECEEVKPIIKKPKKPKTQMQVENLTDEQYEKINQLINSNVKGVTKTGRLRKQYLMTDKKKEHMEKLKIIQRERHEKALKEKEEKQKKTDEEIVNKRINKLFEQKLDMMQQSMLQQSVMQQSMMQKETRKRELKEIKLKEAQEIKPQEIKQQEIKQQEIKPQEIKSRFKIIR
jgi:hypothetical protein